MHDSLNEYQISKEFIWCILLMIVVFTAVLRLSMLQMPLERDEGEYAYMGQLLLQGIPPYLNAYSMKLSGVSMVYAFFMSIFGQSIFAVHLGLLIFNGIAIILIFLLTRYFSDYVAGLFAALIYALLSVSPSLLGTAAHATQFLVPFVLGGFLLLFKAIDQRKTWMLIISGLLLGSSFLMKQHAVVFILFAIIYYLKKLNEKRVIRNETISKTLILLISMAFPFVVLCALLYLAGVFSTFWFWTFIYSSQYALETSIPVAISNFAQSASIVIYPWKWVWAIAGAGLASIIWSKKTRANRFFLVGFSLVSFLSICPGFYFRINYFITLLPAVAILSGMAISTSMIYLSQRFSPFLKLIPVIFILLALSLPAWEQKRFFLANIVDATYMIHGSSNPFPESLSVAEYIKNHSAEGDSIAVIGSEPQIYFYANRISATGYIYMYGLMEPQPYASLMQKKMIREIESVKPRYIVFVNAKFSWLRRADSDLYIFQWIEKYLKDYYILRGVLNNKSDFKIQTDLSSKDAGQLWNNTMSIFEIRQ